MKLIPINESSNATKKDLDKASTLFLSSIENPISNKNKNGLNEINESINYLSYIYSLRLSNVKHSIKAGETLYGSLNSYNQEYLIIPMLHWRWHYYSYLEK